MLHTPRTRLLMLGQTTRLTEVMSVHCPFSSRLWWTKERARLVSKENSHNTPLKQKVRLFQITHPTSHGSSRRHFCYKQCLSSGLNSTRRRACWQCQPCPASSASLLSWLTSRQYRDSLRRNQPSAAGWEQAWSSLHPYVPTYSWVPGRCAHIHRLTRASALRTAAPADNEGDSKRCFLGATTTIQVVQVALRLPLLNNFDATHLLLFKDLPNVPLLKKKMLQR